MMTRAMLAAPLALLACAGCSFMGGSPGAVTATAPVDPTPLARCKIAASATSPLVTEWPASQKAYLEGLTARGAVAVAYSGCELRIVDTCRLAGHYGWRRTTPATDTLEITNADDLWAKLPIGAAALEGELARKGRLAVRTTIAGQLELEGLDPRSVAADASCAGVTHVVSAVSVGAFRLLSGAGTTAQGSAKAFGVGAGASTAHEESVMREAGDPAACTEEGQAAPRNCASPSSSSSRASSRPYRCPRLRPALPASPPRRASPSTSPSPRSTIGTGPCTTRTAPSSATSRARAAYPRGAAGTSRRAGAAASPTSICPRACPTPRARTSWPTTTPSAGAPFLSTLTFWGLGVPAAVGGVLTISFGAAGVGNTPQFNETGFFIGTGVMFLAIAGVSAWWYFWSHPASFDTHAGTATSTGLRLGPGGVEGAF